MGSVSRAFLLLWIIIQAVAGTFAFPPTFERRRDVYRRSKMNLRTLFAAAAFLGFTAGAAFAQNAYTTGNVNMRAGPSTQYPRVTTLPSGAAVDVHGCTSGWSWCDTSWRGIRGWVSANYLQMLYNTRRVYLPEYAPRIIVPVITFQFGNYWDR